MTRSLRTLATAVAVVALGACAQGQEPSSDDTTRSLLGQASSGTPAQRPSSDGTIDVATLGYDMGSGDAPVRVVEMSDFGCSYCRQFHQQTFSTIHEEFIASGKVEWKFMPFITGMWESSIPATEAAECALEQSDELFVRVSDRLWNEQSEWKGSSSTETVVRAMAEAAGADMKEFDACVAEDRRFQRIAAATQLANQLGVRGTPTFFVVGYPPLQGALPVDAFRDILNAVHADATGSGGEGGSEGESGSEGENGSGGQRGPGGEGR